MKEQGKLGQWLEERCKKENLSLRRAATRSGLSHATIAHIANGARPSGETVRKLARAFADGPNARLALEDKLLTLAGYRTERPREELNDLLAQLIDKVKDVNESQIKIIDLLKKRG